MKRRPKKRRIECVEVLKKTLEEPVFQSLESDIAENRKQRKKLVTLAPMAKSS